MKSRTLGVALASLLAATGCEPRAASKPDTEQASSAASPDGSQRSSSLSVASRVLERGQRTAAPSEPGGVLPLERGIFVASDIDCGDPPNAAIRRYDGEGLNGAHTRACQITVLAKQGASYDVEQSCIDAGSGPAPRSSERLVIEVRDRLSFTLKRGQEGETFRHCAASLLPPGLK